MMNIGDIANIFIRAAEIDRNSHEHVGPGALRGQQLPYVHTWSDKAGWRKEAGDKLAKGEDPLADERKAFWERISAMPSAAEITMIDGLFEWLRDVRDPERRALWAWARAKAGGKSFRRWCFNVEGIHPETGRRRKDRALQRIWGHLAGKRDLHDENREIRLLHHPHEISDVSATLAEEAGNRDQLNSWMSDSAFAPFMQGEPQSAFAWAQRRNERRRQREKRKAA